MARKAQSPLGPLALAIAAILLATVALWQTVAAGGGGATTAQGTTTYTVVRYDSLASIAKKYGISRSDLAAANGLEPNAILYRNQVLIIPLGDADAGMRDGMADAAVSTEAEAPMASAAMTATAEAGMSAESMATPAPAEESAEAIEAESTESESMAASDATAEPKTYTVQRYDSLRAIAKKFQVRVKDLAAANGLPVNSILYRNQVLIIPTEGSAAGAVSAAAPMPNTTPEPVEEATEAPTEEPVEEATVEATAEPTAESIEAPTAEATPEPTEEMAEETAEETAEAVTGEATEEATVEPTVEATEETIEETTGEAVEEATEAPTEEPVEEPTAEPTAEATEETTEEATEEPVAEEELMGTDIIAAAEDAGGFTTLLAAIEAAGLTEALQSEGPFTLLAPTDEAFATLPPGTLDELLADPEGDLTQILLYHVIPGKLTAEEIEDGAVYITLQGGELTFTLAGDEATVSTTVNNANLVMTNIETGNGVIHVVDAVLMPPDLGAAPDTPAQAQAAPDGATATSPTGIITEMTEEMTVADAAVILIAPPTQPANGTIVGATAPWQDTTQTLRIITPVSATVSAASNGAGTDFRAAYHSPIAVSGLAHAATGSVHISLIGDDGTILAERLLTTGSIDDPDADDLNAEDPNAFAFFAGHLRYNVGEVTNATLRVVEMDMGDGTILAEARVPITLLGGQRVIDITTPVVGQAVCEEIIISGYSNTFEANVVVSLLTPAGSTQAEIPAIGGNLGVYRDFAAVLTYPVDEPTALLVAATETDASGRFDSIDHTRIPVTVYPADAPECAG